MKSDTKLQNVLDIMARLRDPETGCPWDRQQDFGSIVPHTLEEAYEVAEAIEQGRLNELPGELGDLLFQIVFYARLAEEQGLFDFAQIADTLEQKLVRRHPHVFADVEYADAEAREHAWERFKRDERRERITGEQAGLLSHIPRALPALTRAMKLQKSAARAGFDWDDVHPVFEKIEEELQEITDALSRQRPIDELEAELGDLLFACVNLARHLHVDAETALRRCNRKFENRFSYMERRLRSQGRDLESAGLEELDRLWEEAKSGE